MPSYRDGIVRLWLLSRLQPAVCFLVMKRQQISEVEEEDCSIGSRKPPMEMFTQVVEDELDLNSVPAEVVEATKHTNDPSVWGLDPLYWTYLILLNVHVTKGLVPNGSSWDQVARERARTQCNHMLPRSGRVVAHCHLVGTLVRKQSNSMFKTLTIDDGTALVDCVEWNNEEETEEKGFVIVDPPLGASIRCFGRLDWPGTRFHSSFKQSVRRVVLTRPPVLIQNVNEELLHWDRAMKLWEGHYAQRFVSDSVPTMLSDHRGPVTEKHVYGGVVEDLVMSVIRNSSGKMPLVSSMNEAVIKEKYGPFFRILFEFDTLLKEESIFALLLQEVPKQSSTPENILRLALRKLCFSGQIFMMEQKMDIYAVITHEDFLAPAILRAMVRFGTQFVQHNLLLEKLREDTRLAKISKERFDSSLSRLMMDNCIIEGEPGTFALFRDT